MNTKIYLFIFVLLLISMSACSIGQASTQNRQEVVFDDKKVSSDTDEVIITDADLNGQTIQNAPAGKASREQNVAANDNSKITTMTDSFGNKTEMRCFNNHPLIDCVVVLTSKDGKRQVTIYPTVKGAKSLPENMADQALTAPADELANSSEIYETRASQANKSVSPYDSKKGNKSLTPMPSSKFPIQAPQNQQQQNLETQQNTETVIVNKDDKKNDGSFEDSPPKENLK